MKRIAVNIALIIVFILLLAVIIMPLAAEMQLNRAKKLEARYRWQKAGEKYQSAVRLCPFNAEYLAATGEFLIRQGEYRQDKISWFRRAKRLYARAVKLNPRYAEYHYWLGKVRLELLEVEEAIDDFKTAIERDSYNFRNNYLVGHNLLTVWNFLDEEEKSFTIERLRYTLRSKPWYEEFVYPVIMYYTEDFNLAKEATPATLEAQEKLCSFIVKDNLWQYRRQQKKTVNLYRQKEKPEELKRQKLARLKRLDEYKDKDKSALMAVSRADWQGKSEDGKYTYRNGDMHWSGTIDAVVNLPPGRTRIRITAKGTPADNVFPYMIVGLDGNEIGETLIASQNWQEYIFQINTEGGLQVLSVTFANDGVNIVKNEDRNLYIGDVIIDKAGEAYEQ